MHVPRGGVRRVTRVRLMRHPLAGDDAVAFAQDEQKRVREMVGKKVAEVRAAGGRFASAAAVRRTNPDGCPRTTEKKLARPQGESPAMLAPTVLLHPKPNNPIATPSPMRQRSGAPAVELVRFFLPGRFFCSNQEGLWSGFFCPG